MLGEVAGRLVSETNLSKILRAAAESLAEVEERSLSLAGEADLRTSVELLPEWVEWLRLASDCQSGLPDTTLEQRFSAFQKLVQEGGQSPFHFAAVAQGLGYDIDVVDLREFQEFRVGISRVGDALTNGVWVFVVEVHAPEITPRFARAGLSVAGEPLVTFGNDLLECTLDRLKPAHTLFLYVYDKPYVGYAPWNSSAPAPLAVRLLLPIPTRT